MHKRFAQLFVEPVLIRLPHLVRLLPTACLTILLASSHAVASESGSTPRSTRDTALSTAGSQKTLTRQDVIAQEQAIQEFAEQLAYLPEEQREVLQFFLMIRHAISLFNDRQDRDFDEKAGLAIDLFLSLQAKHLVKMTERNPLLFQLEASPEFYAMRALRLIDFITERVLKVLKDQELAPVVRERILRLLAKKSFRSVDRIANLLINLHFDHGPHDRISPRMIQIPIPLQETLTHLPKVTPAQLGLLAESLTQLEKGLHMYKLPCESLLDPLTLKRYL